MTKPNRISLAIVIFAWLASPAQATERSPVNDWFCSVLRTPFDLSAAVSTFPMDRLSAPVEQRRLHGEEGERRVMVVQEASGETYVVSYIYGISEDQPDTPRNFSLGVRLKDLRTANHEQALSWLTELGEPRESVLGWQLTAGPEFAPGIDLHPFAFEAWEIVGVYQARWSSPLDIEHSMELC